MVDVTDLDTYPVWYSFCIAMLMGVTHVVIEEPLLNSNNVYNEIIILLLIGILVFLVVDRMK